MINIRTARRVLANLEDKRGRNNTGPRKRYASKAESEQVARARSRAQQQAQRGLVQLYKAEYDVFYREALRREGIDA